jgi:hypothetical protein
MANNEKAIAAAFAANPERLAAWRAALERAKPRGEKIGRTIAARERLRISKEAEAARRCPVDPNHHKYN